MVCGYLIPIHQIQIAWSESLLNCCSVFDAIVWFVMVLKLDGVSPSVLGNIAQILGQWHCLGYTGAVTYIGFFSPQTAQILEWKYET